MKTAHLLLAVLITAIWGFNFSVIKLGLTTVDPFILAGIRFTLCALPAVFFIRKPDMPWRYLIGYRLVFGVGQSVANGRRAGVISAAGVALGSCTHAIARSERKKRRRQALSTVITKSQRLHLRLAC